MLAAIYLRTSLRWEDIESMPHTELNALLRLLTIAEREDTPRG